MLSKREIPGNWGSESSLCHSCGLGRRVSAVHSPQQVKIGSVVYAAICHLPDYKALVVSLQKFKTSSFL